MNLQTIRLWLLGVVLTLPAWAIVAALAVNHG